MRTISQIQTLINAGVGTSISAGELMAYNVPPETTLKLVYIPVVTSRAAFEYADVVCQICARKRLNYKEQTRTLKQEMKEYERETIGLVGHEIEEDLKDKVDFFFDEAYSHIEKLQQSVYAEMKKQWPDLTDYTLLLNLYMCVILIDYIWKFERATAQFIQKTTMSPYIPRPNLHLVNIRRACMSIAGDHVLPSSDNIRLAIKILAMNIDKMVKVEVTEN